ncbi:hypothetical protein BgiBS90_025518 [Biomphalaria glabrata]|nr:hypothetical protein BgiBS90_025518 [Biomphalaria glabrata]
MRPHDKSPALLLVALKRVRWQLTNAIVQIFQTNLRINGVRMSKCIIRDSASSKAKESNFKLFYFVDFKISQKEEENEDRQQKMS